MDQHLILSNETSDPLYYYIFCYIFKSMINPTQIMKRTSILLFLLSGLSIVVLRAQEFNPSRMDSLMSALDKKTPGWEVLQ